MTTPHLPVFIVEDSHPMQTCLLELLESIGGFRLAGLAAGETDATDWLFNHRSGWRVAVLDLLLPEGSGFGLVQRCRRENATGHIVVFSEFASPALKDKCVRMGADAVFRKSELTDFVHHLENFAASEDAP
jgi:DNA-binding NarL/FixJ family response regulator